MLQKTVKDGGFIVAMVVISEMFSLTEPFSVLLQAKNLDLASALNMADNLNFLLNELRNNCELKFRELFIEAESCLEEIGEEIKIPGIASRQVYRANYDCNSPEEYYRRSLYIPFIDHFICQLEIRCLKHKHILSNIQNVIASTVVNLNEHEINESIDSILFQWPNIISINDSIVKKRRCFGNRGGLT